MVSLSRIINKLGGQYNLLNHDFRNRITQILDIQNAVSKLENKIDPNA